MIEKIPVILDCDNTMGLPGCDVDDGLALLYLPGSPPRLRGLLRSGHLSGNIITRKRRRA